MLSFPIAISLGQLITASVFFSRQSGPIGNVPPACTGNCSELNTILQSCSATSCLCTQLLLDDLASCSICVGELSGATFDAPQTTLNNLVVECEEAGITLSPILLPGETSLPPPPSTPKASQSGGNNPNPTGAPALASPSTPAALPTTTSSIMSLNSSPTSQLSSTGAGSSTLSQSTPTATQPAQTQSSDFDTSSPSNTLLPAPTVTNSSSRIKITASAGIIMAVGGLLFALS